jgi:transposase
LQQQIQELQAQLAALQAAVARLQKNSFNSSKPPSSDIVKPSKPSPTKGMKRRRGGWCSGNPKNRVGDSLKYPE